MVSENVQTDAAVAVDVGVVYAGCEVDLWRLEWVVCWEMDREEENTAGVWRVARTHDRRLPVELWQVIVSACVLRVTASDGGGLRGHRQ